MNDLQMQRNNHELGSLVTAVVIMAMVENSGGSKKQRKKHKGVRERTKRLAKKVEKKLFKDFKEGKTPLDIQWLQINHHNTTSKVDHNN